MKRHPSLLDPRFRYVPAVSTDITLTLRKFGWLPKREADLPGDRTVVALRPKEKRK